jgi:hypothetical protein
MKIRRRTDEWSNTDRLFVVETVDGKEYDITWYFYGIIAIIMLSLIFF